MHIHTYITIYGYPLLVFTCSSYTNGNHSSVASANKFMAYSMYYFDCQLLAVKIIHNSIPSYRSTKTSSLLLHLTKVHFSGLFVLLIGVSLLRCVHNFRMYQSTL